MLNTRYTHIQGKVKDGKPVYMPYILMGYPSLEGSIAAAKALIDGGADGLELGLPFRDPVADGPVIQDAANIALDKGFKADDALTIIQAIRAYAPDIPLTVMSYFNIVLVKGIEKFIAALAEAGIDGILIPDLPPEHAEDVYPATQANNIELIFIVAPTTHAGRFDKIRPYAGGFIYVVTKMGTTGMNDNFDSDLKTLFADIKTHIDLPAIAGFGISTPAHAQDMAQKGANGVIIGSKIIQMCKESFDGQQLSPALLTAHTKKIQAALTV
tara:strand:+ start:141793 stop:142602 length:810 start_codon:yes stop_codon:yes gene_type:complete